MQKFYVYKITNTVTGWIYIGSTQMNPLGRWRAHEGGMRNQTHTNMRMRADYEKYGVSSFVFEILEILSSKEDMIRSEQSKIKAQLAQGHCYNIMHGDKKIWRQNNDLYWKDRLKRLELFRQMEAQERKN